MILCTIGTASSTKRSSRNPVCIVLVYFRRLFQRFRMLTRPPWRPETGRTACGTAAANPVRLQYPGATLHAADRARPQVLGRIFGARSALLKHEVAYVLGQMCDGNSVQILMDVLANKQARPVAANLS